MAERLLRRRRDLAAHGLDTPLFDPQVLAGQQVFGLVKQEDE
jgi:hypothetical protein